MRGSECHAWIRGGAGIQPFAIATDSERAAPDWTKLDLDTFDPSLMCVSGGLVLYCVHVEEVRWQ